MPRIMPARTFDLVAGNMGAVIQHHAISDPSSVTEMEQTLPRQTLCLELEMEQDTGGEPSFRKAKDELHQPPQVSRDDEASSASRTQDEEATDTTATPSTELKKNVSFHTLHIREYSQVLGDHPCCSLGPPVSLGWDVEREEHVSVDQYEATRIRRRSRDDLRLSGELRREMLSDVSDGAVRRVQRRLHRDKSAQSGKAVERFFQTDAIASIRTGEATTASE